MTCNWLIYSSADLASLPSPQCSFVAGCLCCLSCPLLVKHIVRQSDKVNRSLMNKQKEQKLCSHKYSKILCIQSCSDVLQNHVPRFVKRTIRFQAPGPLNHYFLYCSCHVSHNAALTKVILNWTACWLFGLDSHRRGTAQKTNEGIKGSSFERSTFQIQT